MEMLENIIRMTEKQLLKELPDALGAPVVENGEYLYKPGTVPILLVCHLDTVHGRPPTAKEICRNESGSIWTAPTVGIGGDDRCGVYAVLKLLERFDCAAVFTTGEETGGKGALAFADDFRGEAFNFAIEIDRKGKSDAVFYDCENDKFTDFILEDKFYEEASGSFTDISFICPALGMAGVNLSSGYYNAHTTSEYISIKDLNAAITHAELLIERGKDKAFEYVEKKRVYTSRFYDYYNDHKYGYGAYDYAKGADAKDADGTYPCDRCFTATPTRDLVDTGQEYLCPDCATSEYGVEWCDLCGQATVDWEETPDGSILCPDCMAAYKKEKA